MDVAGRPVSRHAIRAPLAGARTGIHRRGGALARSRHGCNHGNLQIVNGVIVRCHSGIPIGSSRCTAGTGDVTKDRARPADGAGGTGARSLQPAKHAPRVHRRLRPDHAASRRPGRHGTTEGRPRRLRRPSRASMLQGNSGGIPHRRPAGRGRDQRRPLGEEDPSAISECPADRSRSRVCPSRLSASCPTCSSSLYRAGSMMSGALSEARTDIPHSTAARAERRRPVRCGEGESASSHASSRG